MQPKRLNSYLMMILVITHTLMLLSCSSVIHKLGGNFKYKPEQMDNNISPAAQLLIDKSFEGHEGKYMIDYHTHVIGIGSSCKECFIHPDFYDLFSPLQRYKFKIYMSASGIKNPKNVDQEYVDRLVSLIRESGKPMKSAILAFDKYYNLDGSEDLKKTQFYVPNSYVYELSQRFPDIFIPVISVHPYRIDAIDELERWANKGVKIVKWLPNAMGIDPSHPKTLSFYRKMEEHHMILLAHAGYEQAVNAEEDQELGNPLLLREVLKHKVKVIIAHCASLGTCVDLDAPDKNDISCFDLFLRMMGEKKYEGLLYGDISALLQHNRLSAPLKEILTRPALHSRLVNGTDYPLVAINSLIRTGELEKEGFITETEKGLLNEIYDYNPLLFEFVLKRTIKLPGTNKQLSSNLFFHDLLYNQEEVQQ